MKVTKKTTTKSKSSPAPATKPAVATKSVVAAKPAAKKKPAAAKPAPATSKVTAGLAAVAAKAVVAQAASTIITARIDVGFGNVLFLRGEGAGLSWDRGVPMTCVQNDLWRVTLPDSARGCTVKFLINDTTWSVGPDIAVAGGQDVTLSPAF